MKAEKSSGTPRSISARAAGRGHAGGRGYSSRKGGCPRPRVPHCPAAGSRSRDFRILSHQSKLRFGQADRVRASLLVMAAAVAMETGALCLAPRVFTTGMVLRPEILSRFPFPALSFGLNLASLELGPAEKAVLLLRIWPVRTSSLLGCSNPFSNPGTWGSCGRRLRPSTVDSWSFSRELA